ncbi:MAG: GNAT family N-acetyltransferase [Desulfurococcales archaeon]|nr:GNAT family N-acetyltransferase [Desulfurococcales archaeon]
MIPTKGLRPAVREASEDDVDSIAVMVARLKTLNEELDPSFRVREDLLDAARQYVRTSINSSSVILLVADVGGETVGFIRVELVDRVFYEPRIKALITDLYVKPEYRRRGVGKLLLESAIEEARKRGAGIISAVFPEGNVIAKSFYQNLGFKPLQLELFKPIG